MIKDDSFDVYFTIDLINLINFPVFLNCFVLFRYKEKTGQFPSRSSGAVPAEAAASSCSSSGSTGRRNRGG